MKWLDAFLEFKNEAEGTRRFALFAVIVITLGLASLSITGVIATANWTWMSILPTIGVIIAVAGAEALATVVFVRTLTAPTLKRRITGYIMFVGLAAVGVHNAENGAKVVWSERFAESSSSLAAKSGVSKTQAKTMATNQPRELELVRGEIAKLEVFTKKMSAQTPEGIKEAQSEMIPRCGYTGQVDGIRAARTESAMRSCGEQIRNEILILKQRETNLLGTAPAAAGAIEAADPAIAAIELQAKADEAFWAFFWLIFMLVVLECARSLALWALITDMTGTGVNRQRERDDELAEAEHQRRLNELRNKLADFQVGDPPVVQPPPVVTPEPAVEDQPPPPQQEELLLTAEQQRSRKGGQAAQHARKAARNIKKVPVTDDRDEDEMFEVQREAAQ